MDPSSVFQPLLQSGVRFDAPQAGSEQERLGVETTYPLSPLQEAMLFHAVASDTADLYAVQQRIDIEGLLDPEAFQQAWSLVIQRHPALRTIFDWEGLERPVQRVLRRLDVPVELIDLTDDQRAHETVDARFEEDRRRRFHPDTPPLMRIALFRLAPDRHIMMWSQHHLIQDAWSASNVLSEVFAAHEAITTGRHPDLPPVRAFGDYIAWLEAQDEASTEAFWSNHLEGITEPTLMAAIGSADGAAHARRFRALSPELTGQLDAMIRSRGLSLNSVLVGSLAIAISRYVGRSDVVCGVVASGRPPTLAGVEAMVGMFINTLPLHIAVDPGLSVVDYLRDVQTRQASVLAHDHAALTDIQAWSDLDAGRSLTDTLFAYWSFGDAGASPDGGLRFRTVDGHGRTSFPLAVTVEAADPINIGLDFDAGAFDPERAELFLEHYGAILDSIVTDPDQAVGDVTMLTAAERERLVAYNATEMPVPPGSVVDAIRAQARATPHEPAVVFGDEVMTYAELDAASDHIADRVIQAGGFGAPRVALYLPRSAELVVAILGVLKAGAAFVPIDRHLPRDRIAQLLADSAAEFVVTSVEMVDALPASGPAVLIMATDPPPGDFDFEILIDPKDLAYVMYTSGSTGTPKGVMVTHEGLLNYVWWARDVYGSGDPISLPFYTSVGFDLTVTSLFVPLASGGRVVVYPDDDGSELVVRDVFEDDRVDAVKLTPSHLAVLEERHLKTRRIRSLILGGEELRAEVAQLADVRSGGALTIYNEYGPTEATVGCMLHRFDPARDTTGSVPIGRPAANCRIYVLDAGRSPVPVGVAGELYVAGSGLAVGYLNRQDLTDEVFVADPSVPGDRMYRTGDLARWREPDVLEYLGRSDDQVKLRGHRIEPGEIEAVLTAHPAVVAAAVAVREPSPGDARLVAYYVAEPSRSASVTELRRHLLDRLPEYMVARHLVRVDALPLTPNGKLDRASLPETIGEVTTPVTFVTPRTASERLVARLSAELLGVSRVSISDNFFELGGHSILAMQLIARIHSETGVRLSPRVILLNTLEQAAALLPATDDEVEHAAPVSAPASPRAAAVSTTAHFFGPADRALFGIHATPSGANGRRRAVLLCPPLGWEYMRTHWTMRRIARLLAADGFHALRFDYFGTGDSCGDGEAVSVAQWVDDVTTAAAELRDHSGAEKLSIVAVRLAAPLATIAVGGGLRVDELVLWDPVVNGSTYLRTLERMHGDMLERRGGRRGATVGGGAELLGSPYPPQLRREIEEIDLLASPLPPVATTVIATEHRAEYEQLAVAHGQVRIDLVDDPTAWDDLASTHSALLPARVPNHVVQVLGGAP